MHVSFNHFLDIPIRQTLKLLTSLVKIFFIFGQKKIISLQIKALTVEREMHNFLTYKLLD